MSKEIELTKGYKTIIDDADFNKVSRFKWHVGISEGRPYAVSWMNGKHIYLHRFLLNFPKRLQVTFKNGDSLDNRRENLKAVSELERRGNKRISANNKTGFKGVSLYKPSGKYKAYIKSKGKLYHLGLFLTAEEAARAYNVKAAEIFGELARLNEVPEKV